ncbi:heme-binding protein [Mycobacterium sp. Y57]|uniref:heme-binding protein n=1 Tax=Mycolicibacterium xanthum TaxID=2796469 RepID=UPI001C845198|nr:heme-binding protein [Mycolicibacterium xanthum]MBX7431710.1 heme-binding protein [Mycolicibacterium xanthum]
MLFTAPTARRVVAGALGASALAGAALFGVAPMASAQPLPPNCTAADFAGVAAGVSAASSAYLFTHPDVNAFFTGLHGKPRDEIKSDVIGYMDRNPQIAAEMTGIRQPLIDIKNRCGFAGLGNPDSPAA